MASIINKSTGDLSSAAHAIKSLLEIKFTRAGQRHASAMGFRSANHLLEAMKSQPIEQDFDEYIEILKSEVMTNHQIIIDDALKERLGKALLSK